ncbi:MAG: class II aldolase/adducin family protein [Patescibacteria group bacterium]|nr:class II aldolase/adducin family protein [Patescibacteria group bacterium]
MPTEREYRKEMIAVSRRIYEKGFVAAHDGNLTIKLDDNRFLATPSGFCKGDLTENGLIICDAHGQRITGRYKVTSEILMHLKAYSQRSDICAAIHAHPTMAIAFSLAGISLAKCLLPEMVLTVGTIPTTNYATPSTIEGADVIQDLIKNYDVMIVDRHGSFTVGKTLWDAYFKLERLEHVAQVTYYARQLGPLREIPKEEMSKLISRAARLGVNPGALACNTCGTCGKKRDESNGQTNTQNGDGVDRSVIESIAREVIQSL